MAKEITLELLTEAVTKQGLAAAKALADAACAEVDAATERAKVTITAAESQLEDLGRRKSMYQTLLIGAVRKASTEAGVELAQPAAKPTKPGRRTRGAYAETAQQFVLNLLQMGDATSGEIKQAWEAAGRSGGPDSALTPLVRDGKITRAKLVGKNGYMYSLA